MVDLLCAFCNEKVVYWQSHCVRCSNLVGFPNYRAAAAELPDLEKRSTQAVAELRQKGLGSHVSLLQACVDRSVPVINMPIHVCYNLIQDKKYLNYRKLVEAQLRLPAAELDAAARSEVGKRLFAEYDEHITYAAMTPDYRGLTNYGAVAVRWAVKDFGLIPRMSILEENSYTFFDKYGLIDKSAAIPPGHRAIWQDRAKLALSKIAPKLEHGTTEQQISEFLLQSGKTREEDKFMEIHIFAERSLDREDILSVDLQSFANNKAGIREWQTIKEECAKLNITVLENSQACAPHPSVETTEQISRNWLFESLSSFFSRKAGARKAGV